MPKDIQLIGGPFCGASIHATIQDLTPGEAIATDCSDVPEKTNNDWDHLEAVYLITPESKGLFFTLQEKATD
ncbi:MAG: hypothetical protein ACPH5P_00205 [Akkermansiaceae bacterium]